MVEEPNFHLTTERLQLRPWSPADVSSFRPIAQDPDVMKYIGPGKTWTDSQVENFVHRQVELQQQRGFSLWPIIHRADAALIGFCGLQPLGDTGEIEIGWWLAVAYWGQGLATEAATKVLSYGLTELKLSRIVSIAQPANTASTKIMQKLGMTFERRMEYRGIETVLYAIGRARE
jgi:RimJ/RimL family protein N-acetyltransferase